MAANIHPDYKIEEDYLNYTLGYVKSYHERIFTEKLRIDKEVDYGVRHYNSDNAEQFNDLIINTTLQDNLSQKVKNLNLSLLKPYFARVDFIEAPNKKHQVLYIGKISLLRDEDQKLIIVDWRAPISTLYYEGRLGNSSYICPDGEISGEIKLKRQYTIENAELKEIYDIDITTNDDFLQACLGSSKDNRLKDIVSTIQAEQNRVIRADMWKPLIVQGAAGGGKTTIALHRIAYLLYNYEKTMSPKNFMIIAPNRFFLSYISEVLPDLGVENVIQTTFEDFAMEITGMKVKIHPSYNKLSLIVNQNHDISQISKDIIQRISTFKSSLTFKDMIDTYISNIEYDFLPTEDYKIDTFVLLSYEELFDLFTIEYSHLPLLKRIAEIKKHLVNTLKLKKGAILEYIEKKYDREIDVIRYNLKDSEERRRKIIDIANDRDNLINKVKKESKTLVKDYLDKISTLSPLDYYKNMLYSINSLVKSSEQTISKELLTEFSKYTIDTLKEGYIEIEDLAPLMYIKYLIYGLEDKISVRHIVIDEAQDFSLFQLYVLKKIINSSSFTILGDLSQGIYSYRGTKNWSDLQKYIFPEDTANFLTLEQSYRTTIEIMNAANKVINKLKNAELPQAKPVLRHGSSVELIEKDSLKNISIDIIDKINTLMEDGYKSAAIICKTMEECLEVKAFLSKFRKDIKIILGNEKFFSGGIAIIPSYLVKGLEFDAVFITNANRDSYTENELDIKLLYVAMTRPLHFLTIYSIGEVSTLLEDIC
jgi:DNA helicase-2/ATP-dependent DNA helicase PcrA